ncbi:MAG: DNA-binding HxlR family transcriptional regulator [Gammaproteobacteria bacterium]|jgi:DNA-binding HxlR family transcriptional regulator
MPCYTAPMSVQKKMLKEMSFQRSDCPIACALDVIGDKWTLLIIRDLLRGKQRFSEFMDSQEGLKTNILTDRLKRLQNAGLLERSAYQDNPPRYQYALTDEGKDLWPMLKEMILWANKNIPGTTMPLKKN